ncbi:hypothetical protein L2D00_12975 [Hyphomonadaceae bacterium BL14]|nr:hypothetical protein L2D00_12975 [Hyphomonadaceae bacterium BL14]
MNKTLLLAGTLGILLVASIAFAIWGLGGGGLQITWHGWLAMALGVVLSLAVGGGLMTLVFYSARHGHDDIDREP